MTKNAELSRVWASLRRCLRLGWLLIVAMISALYVLGFAVVQCFQSVTYATPPDKRQ